MPSPSPPNIRTECKQIFLRMLTCWFTLSESRHAMSTGRFDRGLLIWPPGYLLQGGSRIVRRRGRQHTNLADFPKKLHEIKKILVRRGHPPWIRHCTGPDWSLILNITSNDRPFGCPINSQCYFVHRHLNNAWHNNAHTLMGTPCLTITASNETRFRKGKLIYSNMLISDAIQLPNTLKLSITDPDRPQTCKT